MRNVIWGIGYYASLLTIKLGRGNISFFIDNDEKKSGYYLGKKVVTPDSIDCWDDMYVYVPYNYYDEISAYLKTKGLRENVNFSMYNEIVIITSEQAETDYRRACAEVDKLDVDDCLSSIAWYGRFWASKKEYRDCINILKDGPNEVIILADTPWCEQYEIEKNMQCKSVVFPSILHDFVFIEDSDCMSCDISQEVDVMKLSTNIQAKRKGGAMESSIYKASMSVKFIDYLFSHCRFKTFIIGGSDRAISKMIRDKCRKYNIPTLFTHQGIIPKTIMIGPGGDVGDSMPAVYYKQFRELPVGKIDLDEAENVWEWLRESRANRKVQPHSSRKEILNHVKCDNRPIVLCLGQNDADSTLIPYTDESKRYQSPVFKSSMESVVFLADICKNNNWNLIYKPHPMYAEFEDYNILPNNVSLMIYADINEMIDIADVVVTIRSSSNYIALIRHKPVLMLGYTQTRGQGCTYEAFTEEEIEPQLKLSLKKGFTKEQKKAFLAHLARLLKYYLYDDMSERPVRYGLPFSSRVEKFFLLENRLKSMVGKV